MMLTMLSGLKLAPGLIPECIEKKIHSDLTVQTHHDDSALLALELPRPKIEKERKLAFSSSGTHYPGISDDANLTRTSRVTSSPQRFHVIGRG